MTVRRLACVALLTLLFGAACGPMGPLAGGALSGAVQEDPPPEWSGFADVEQIQVESRPSDPHSVNTWCGVVDGRFYVPSSLIMGPDDPSERGWVQHVLADPNVRLRIEDEVYELRATRVEDPAERERVRDALIAKYEVERDAQAEKAWIFRMEPR